MTKIKNLLLLIGFVLFSLSASSQGFTSPANGNAAVYFVRVSGYGGAASFEYFHNQDFISVFKGKNYMRYECPAGEHLFWASSEDKEFLDCDLAAGETYLVLVNIEMGAWKARVGLEPVTIDNKDFDRVMALVQKKKPIVTSEAKIQSTTRKLAKRDFVETVMERYQTEWKNSPHTQTINPDMFIPKELLK
ncbi:MAG: hypothetical protein B7C24_07790 [Bacteroidetes bacterium 4572_77]|nr:MAG: hypothetical protein B7C24_07790 [Bacteroidetes bacterium 4572_77]